jgi:hypothetical protein
LPSDELGEARVSRTCWLLVIAAIYSICSGSRGSAPVATDPIPDGLGVNIHFTHARPGEMKLLAESGVTWVRMDFFWADIEKTRGVYDFFAYDYLIHDLEARHLQALFILDYGNPLYEKDSPANDQTRTAFAMWAAASAAHFASHGVIWEMWNEPNGGFWKPRPDATDYARLALATGRAIHQAQPTAIFIGPATAGVDLPFCEACFKAGCLAEWAAVSVHPYRQTGPESVIADYRKLNELIAQYAPPGKVIPIISGEWGWSTAWKTLTPYLQADFLARQWMVNRWQHVPLSIDYDWHDDGTDPHDPEDHFGMVENNYEPKPAYLAVKTLTTQLAGFTFDRRLSTAHPEDYVMLFKRRNEARLVVWTAAKASAEIQIIAPDTSFKVFSATGTPLPKLQSVHGLLAVKGTGSLQYLIPTAGTTADYASD